LPMVIFNEGADEEEEGRSPDAEATTSSTSPLSRASCIEFRNLDVRVVPSFLQAWCRSGPKNVPKHILRGVSGRLQVSSPEAGGECQPTRSPSFSSFSFSRSGSGNRGSAGLLWWRQNHLHQVGFVPSLALLCTLVCSLHPRSSLLSFNRALSGHVNHSVYNIRGSIMVDEQHLTPKLARRALFALPPFY